MPVPQGLHQRTLATKFFRRQVKVAGGFLFATVFMLVQLWTIATTPTPAPGTFSIGDRLFLVLFAYLVAALYAYTFYRCPNCNARPFGKQFPGFSPYRCPSCKIGLK